MNRALGENGRQKLIANYTWEVVTEKVLEAYREVTAAYMPDMKRPKPSRRE